MEIRMRPQTPREQFEPDGDPYVLRGRQRELERITKKWAELPEFVSVVWGGPGQGKSTLVRALVRHADELGLLPVPLESMSFVDSDHVLGRTFNAMCAHQQRVQSSDSVRDYPEREDDLRSKSDLGSERRYNRAEDFAELATQRGWPGVVALVDDAAALSARPEQDPRVGELARMAYDFDEWLNRGMHGECPTCLVLVGSSNLLNMMLNAFPSRSECLKLELPVFDEPTAMAVIRDHLDVADADGVCPAAVPDDWVVELAGEHRTCVRDLAAAGHYLQVEAMTAARAGQAAVPTDAWERIEANVQIAQAADCARRVASLMPLERLIAYAAGQAAAPRKNRVKDQYGSYRKELIRQVVGRAAEHDPKLVPTWADDGFKDDREFCRALDHRLLNAGVVDEANGRGYSMEELWSMGTPALGAWLEQRRVEGLAQAAPADRWRWDWTKDIWEAFRDDRMAVAMARLSNEEIPEATEPDPAATTAAPPRSPELPAPGEVPPWVPEDVTA